MDQEDIQPAPREGVLFDIRYGLSRAFSLWPRKRDYREEDFQGWANAILTHLETAGVRFYRKVPGRNH